MSRRLYTGRGDKGETGLWDGSRVSKRDPRIELNGTLDEVGAAVGLARSLAPRSMWKELLGLQQRLQDLMAYVARGSKNVEEPQAASIERWIDEISEAYPTGGAFVFPGESPAGGALHVARAVVRRAERVALRSLADGHIGSDAYETINRLSDLLFALAGKADAETKVDGVVKRVLSEMKREEISPEISLAEATTLIEAAKAEALAMKVPMVFAVCDGAGATVALQRMEGALPVSLVLAPGKASTSARLKMDTDALAPLVLPGAPLYGLAADASIVPFGGGKLLRRGAAVAGAIGVSGGSVEEDVKAASAAVELFASIGVR